MDKELIYKNLENLIELRKIFWAVVTVLTGGIFTLFLNIFTPFKPDILHITAFIFKFIGFTVGIIVDYALISSIKDNNKEINYLLNKLKKEV